MSDTSHKKFSNIRNFPSSVKKPTSNRPLLQIENAFSNTYEAEDLLYCPELQYLVKNNVIPRMNISSQLAFPLRQFQAYSLEQDISKVQPFQSSQCQLISLQKPEFFFQNVPFIIDYVPIEEQTQ